MSMDFRRATVDDAPELARAHVASWHAAYQGLVPDSFLEGFTYERRTEQLRQSLASGAEETYLVEKSGKVLGFLTLGACRDADVDAHTTGEIWGIYLAPKHWRKGIGSYLCKQGDFMLKTRGYVEATLWVLEGNAQARQFYETMGFEPNGETKRVNLGIPLKAVRYRKAIEDAEPPRALDAVRYAGDA